MPAIERPRLLALPERLDGENIVVRPYQRGDAAAHFAAIHEDRAELAEWVAWTDNFQTLADSEDYVLKMAGRWALGDA